MRSQLISNRPPSFPQRVYQHLQDALSASQEVILRMDWGSLTGVPIYVDETCVELMYLYVTDPEDEDEDEEFCWRTVWLLQLEDICALSYSSEGWSKERFDQLLRSLSCRLKQQE